MEPFAGSAAITLAAAARSLAHRYLIADLNELVGRNYGVLLSNRLKSCARHHETLWRAQHEDRRRCTTAFAKNSNRTGKPDRFLYLLARCVKASVRYNADGEFNQSPDNRRMGARPATMRQHILGASQLLRGKSACLASDYKEILAQATPDDLVYLDPPYQGVCGERDPRYLQGVLFHEFVEVLETLNYRDIKYLVSYDGRTGERVHGRKLPPGLRLHHVELHAGRSSQATLLGREEMTIESLYLSPALAESLNLARRYPGPSAKQLTLLEEKAKAP